MKKVVGIVIFVMAIIIGIFVYKINKLDDQNQLKSVEISMLKDSVLNVVTQNGQLISKIESVEVDKDNLRDALKIMGLDIKELRKDNIKKNNLIFAMRAQLEAIGSISTTVYDTIRTEILSSGKIDTVYYKKVEDWTDNKLSLFDGTIEDNRLNFKDYTFKVGFDFFLTEKRNKSIVSVKFPDPSVKLITANSITISHKTKWYEKPWLWGAIGLTTGIIIK